MISGTHFLMMFAAPLRSALTRIPSFVRYNPRWMRFPLKVTSSPEPYTGNGSLYSISFLDIVLLRYHRFVKTQFLLRYHEILLSVSWLLGIEPLNGYKTIVSIKPTFSGVYQRNACPEESNVPRRGHATSLLMQSESEGIKSSC